MKMKVLLITITTLAVFLGYGFRDIGDDGAGKQQQKVSGEELFQLNCSACHGIDRQGKPPVFPSLVSVSERMSREQVLTLLQTGRKVMPSFVHLSEQEREAIAGYLFGETMEAEIVTDITPEQNGQRFFVANCARCHMASPDDPQPPDQREWGMQPAVLGGITASYDVETFKSVLNSGPCYMPSFDFLGDSDKEDIYIYLATMEGLYDNTGNSRMMGCRMRCRDRY